MSETLRKYGAKFNRTFCTFTGLSTDTKPTGVYEGVNIANGSEFIEMDTDKKYLYDAESQTWKLAASGGGGGGSATLIEKTITENNTYNASDDGADGYSSVTVNVPSAPTPETITVNMALVADAATVSATQATVTANKTYEEVKTVIQNGGKVTFNITYAVEGSSTPSEPLTILCYDYNDGAVTGMEGIIIFTTLSIYRTIIWMSDSESAFIQSQTGQNIFIVSL